jgi:hypothetical protein
MNKTAKEELQDWDNILDEYEKGLGIPKYNNAGMPEQELNNYLTMDRTELEKITPEDCSQISYRLAQFSFYVQRTINREIARNNWADETIKMVIADEINNYKGYGYVEKSLQAIKNNEKAQAINKIKIYSKQRTDRLSYLANSIKNLSDILISIQKIKLATKNG